MKRISIIKYLLLAVGLLVGVVFYLSMGNLSSSLSAEGNTIIDVMLVWTYVLLGVAVAALVVLTVLNIVKNPRTGRTSVIGLGVILLAGAVAYIFADADPIAKQDGGAFDNVTILKLSDIGLFLTYFALGAAVLVVLAGEVLKSIKMSRKARKNEPEKHTRN